MTWQDQLQQNLIALRGDRSVLDLADETGIPAPTLYNILAGRRGIGSDTLEQLRRTKPDLVASVFLPDDYPVGPDDCTTGAGVDDSENEIVGDEAGS